VALFGVSALSAGWPEKDSLSGASGGEVLGGGLMAAKRSKTTRRSAVPREAAGVVGEGSLEDLQDLQGLGHTPDYGLFLITVTNNNFYDNSARSSLVRPIVVIKNTLLFKNIHTVNFTYLAWCKYFVSYSD